MFHQRLVATIERSFHISRLLRFIMIVGFLRSEFGVDWVPTNSEKFTILTFLYGNTFNTTFNVTLHSIPLKLFTSFTM